MYIEYGGKELEKISADDVGINITSFFILQFPAAVMISLIGAYKGMLPLLLLELAFWPLICRDSIKCCIKQQATLKRMEQH